MRKIDPSFITPTLGQPYKQGTWYHLMSALTDISTGMVTSMVGNNYSLSAVYKLQGCEMSGTVTRTFTTGWVSFNGELFYFAGASLPAPTTGVYVCNIGTTYFTDPIADPVTFSDGITTHNVHQIRTLTISEAATHTGTMGGIDFDEMTYVGQLPTEMVLQSGFFVGTYEVELNRKVNILFTTPVPATPTFDILPTNQVVGNTVRLYWEGAAGTGSSITITATGTIIGTSGIALAAGEKGVAEFTYIGNDGSGDIYLVNSYT